MDRHTQSPRRARAAQVLWWFPGHIWPICFLLLNLGLQASGNMSKCSIITQDHLRFLDEMMDSQLLTSCNVTFTFVDLPDRSWEQRTCSVRRAFSWMGDLFREQMEFKANTVNFNHTLDLKKLLRELRKAKCIPQEEEKKDRPCSKEFFMSPVEMLKMVKKVFSMSKELLKNNTSIYGMDCEAYQLCSDDDVEADSTPGPSQCDCSCPSPKPTRSDAASLLLTATTASSALRGSKENTARKDQTPSKYTPSATRERVLRVARTPQISPWTPESLEAPESQRTSTVILPSPTAVSELVSVSEALEPWFPGTVPILEPSGGSGHGSTASSEEAQEKHQESRGTDTQSWTLGTAEDRIFPTWPGGFQTEPSTAFAVSADWPRNVVTKGAIAPQTSREDRSTGRTEAPQTSTESIGSTEAPVSVTKGAITPQTSREDRSTGSTNAPQTSREDRSTGRTEAPQTSREDRSIGRTEAPQTSREDWSIGRTEAPQTSREDRSTGRTDAPQTSREDKFIVTEATKEEEEATHRKLSKGDVLSLKGLVSVTKEAATHWTSTEKEHIASYEAPVSVTYGWVTDMLDTPRTVQLRTSPSTDQVPALVAEETTRETPNPGARGHICSNHAPERPDLSAEFQGGEGMRRLDEREDGFAGPHYESNFLPVLGAGHPKGTQKQAQSKHQYHVYVLVVLIPGFLLSMCGLFYYMHINQSLRLELQRRSGSVELPEERPLNRLHQEELQLEEV